MSETAKLPVVYVAARQALAECVRLDECREWSARAEALKSYARQMKDTKLEEDAQRIRNRAVQRAGELLAEIKAEQGKRTDKLPSHEGQRSAREAAAKDAGLTPKQAKTAIEVARVEKQRADEMIEASPPASVKDLAAAGRKTRPPEPKPEPPPYGEEYWAWTVAVREVAETPACGLKVLAARLPAEVPDLLAECRQAIENLKSWERELEGANGNAEGTDKPAGQTMVALS
jgi:hypothetical protein